jgi:hypothetical protein
MYFRSQWVGHGIRRMHATGCPSGSCRLGFYGKTCAGFNDACTTLRWYDPVLEGIPHELDCF